MKVLLVWEYVGQETNLYAFDDGSEMAKLALEADGLYINHNDELGDAVNRLNERLVNYGHMKLSMPIAESSRNAGPYSAVSVCGFIV